MAYACAEVSVDLIAWPIAQRDAIVDRIDRFNQLTIQHRVHRLKARATAVAN